MHTGQIEFDLKLNCAACSKLIREAQVSGKTARRKPLCETCAVALDSLRTVPARIILHGLLDEPPDGAYEMKPLEPMPEPENPEDDLIPF